MQLASGSNASQNIKSIIVQDDYLPAIVPFKQGREQHAHFSSPTRPVFTCADGSIAGNNVHLPTPLCQGLAQKIHCSLPIGGFLLARMEQLSGFNITCLTPTKNALIIIDHRQSSSGMNIYSRNLLKPPACFSNCLESEDKCKHATPSRPTSPTNQRCHGSHALMAVLWENMSSSKPCDWPFGMLAIRVHTKA